MMLSWWTMFVCLYNGFDYTTSISEAVGRRYCPEVTEPGMAVILDVQSDVTPPESFAEYVEEFKNGKGDPWLTYYVVTSKNRADADPGAECGATSRYWVFCYDRWMEYDSGRTECLHDCQVFSLYDWVPREE